MVMVMVEAALQIPVVAVIFRLVALAHKVLLL
jgi:hypothetical protein